MNGALSADGPTAATLPALSTRQRRVLVLIDEYVRATKEPCPAAYVARRMRSHRSTIQEHFSALYRKGWLRTPHSPASLRRDPR